MKKITDELVDFSQLFDSYIDEKDLLRLVLFVGCLTAVG